MFYQGMRQRIEFPANGPGKVAANKQRNQNGGWIVEVENKRFDSIWFEKLYWYSHDHLRGEIFKEVRGDYVTIK